MYYHKREQMTRLVQAITSSPRALEESQLKFLEEHLTPWASKRVKAEQRLVRKMKRDRLNKTVKIKGRNAVSHKPTQPKIRRVTIDEAVTRGR